MVASLAVTLTLLLVLKFSANLVSSLAHFIILSYSNSTYSLELSCGGELCAYCVHIYLILHTQAQPRQ